jgi:16S rRNA (guanine527-N7)-methyltransferase
MSGQRTGRVGEVFGPAQFASLFGASASQISRLETYAALLIRWQAAVNLVSPATLGDIWCRHFADSAQLVRYLGASRVCVDLGSGAGFPGMILAMLAGAEIGGPRIHLIESNGRKCAFLREVARKTGTSVEIHQARIEAVVEAGIVSGADVVVARALAPLTDLLALSQPLFCRDTRALFLKGRGVAAEIELADKSWRFCHKVHPSMTDAEGAILEIGMVDRLEE